MFNYDNVCYTVDDESVSGSSDTKSATTEIISKICMWLVGVF